MRVQADLGVNAVLAPVAGSIAISRDATAVAFSARPLGIFSLRNGLYVRRLDRLDAQLLGGTEGAAAPFFSPDGESIGFFSDGALKKIGANGGPVVTICAADNQRGG